MSLSLINFKWIYVPVDAIVQQLLSLIQSREELLITTYLLPRVLDLLGVFIVVFVHSRPVPPYILLMNILQLLLTKHWIKSCGIGLRQICSNLIQELLVSHGRIINRPWRAKIYTIRLLPVIVKTLHGYYVSNTWIVLKYEYNLNELSNIIKIILVYIL